MANSFASAQPGTPIQVRLCNVGTSESVLKKGSVIGYSTVYEGPVVAMVEEKPQPLPGKAPPSIAEVVLEDAPKKLHTKIPKILDKRKTMWYGTVGFLHATVHRMDTEDGTAPIQQAPDRTGLRKREIITHCVNAMHKEDVIRRRHSVWSSPVVVVPKKNGEPRFCVDYRRLNAITRKEACHIPRVEDCLDSLGEAQFFWTLDCTAGYLQVPLLAEDREKTAFTCHDGLFEWLVMPFLLTNAPATFQRALDVILSGLKWKMCLVYLEDAIVFSKTAEDHIHHQDTVLTLLRKAGVTLNLERYSFFK